MELDFKITVFYEIHRKKYYYTEFYKEITLKVRILVRQSHSHNANLDIRDF